MVCKEDVVSWFKNLKSHTRIDVMCNLLHLCVPFELRFYGTCLEDLGKRDFQDLRTTETGANNPSELSSPDLQCISDKRARTKLALYISVLHSCNYACSNGFYKILANIEEVINLIKCNGVSSADDEVLEELLLIYTLALNHPAFSFDQKIYLGEVFTKLQQEEERRHLKRSRLMHGSTGIEAIDKHPKQMYGPCSSPEQVPVPVHPPTNVGHCAPMTPAALTGDPLVSMPEPLIGYIPYSVMTGYPMMLPPPPPPQEQRSPMVSRTNSPCQSNSPSRAGSPGRPKPLPASFNRPPPIVDPLRDPMGKDVMPHLNQLRNLSEEECRERGFDSQLVNQLRTLENKLHTTNGFNVNAKKHSSTEPDHHCDVSGGPLRRYNSADGPLNPHPHPPHLYYPYPCLCLTTSLRTPNVRSLPQQFMQHMRSMSLDQDTGSLHNSSASDSASPDHSPPDTPSLSLSTTSTSDRGPPPVPVSEVWEDQRIPEVPAVVGGDDRRLVAGLGRARGVGRSNRSNPPGIQTLPRGRGHNPAHRRRDSNSANGTMEERKVYSNSDSGSGGLAFPYSAPFLPPNQFIHTYPSFTSQSGVIRLPFHHPNGEMIYHHIHQPFLPARPTPPSHLPFSPMVPPPKISCYNCGVQGHVGSDCPEANIEEITNKGQYRIDYGNMSYSKPGECSTAQDK